MKRILYHIGYCALYVPLCFGTTVSCEPGYDWVFSGRKLLTRSADQLRSTAITPHLRAPIRKGQNVVWSNTFQLAWNQCCRLIGEDIRLADEPEMVAILNLKGSTRKDLDEESYIAMAGFVRDDIHGQIRAALKKKFQGRTRPRYIPSRGITPRPQDIVAYADLFKNLEFATPFEDVEAPLVFDGTPVECFGKTMDKKASLPLLKQVVILHYRDRADFVIELKTKSEKDRVILAKVSPAGTLRETLAAVERRVAVADEERETALAAIEKQTLPRKQQRERLGEYEELNRCMGPNDILMVPKFNFDLTRRFHEVCDKLLLVRNPAIAKDLLIVSALQNIRLQMDEKGVRLRSEAHMSLACSAPAPAEHIMIFDRPFLLVLKRVGAKAPYFAMWVDNPELLLKDDH